MQTCLKYRDKPSIFMFLNQWLHKPYLKRLTLGVNLTHFCYSANKENQQ